MKKIMDILDLKDVVLERWTELEDIPHKYLSEAGIAARESYRAIVWYLSFYDSIEELKKDEELANLVNIPDKHPEYYKIIRMFNRRVEDLK